MPIRMTHGWRSACRYYPIRFRLKKDMFPLDPAISRRLESGNAASAVKSALQRLRSVGIGTTIRFATVSPEAARLWMAALAFPVNRSTAAGFLRRLTTNKTERRK